MARKRRPFKVAGETVELSAPGLNLIRSEPYWLPSKAAARRGYVPRAVRLHYAVTFAPTPEAILVDGARTELEKLAKQCAQLWAEMLDWLGDPAGHSKPLYDGTLASLIDCYQRDPESGYHGLGTNTKKCYDEWCIVLDRLAGSRRVDRITGRDLRKWFLSIMDPLEPEGAPRVRLARGCVRQMTPILLNYGAELNLPGCLGLVDVLDRMTLRVPKETRTKWKLSRPKKIAMSYEQAEGIVRAGLAKGTRRHRSVAIGVAAQFEFTLRQIDVIGSWEKLDRVRELPANAITKQGKVWQPGLRYEDLMTGVLDLSTSKNDMPALFDIVAYPLFQMALAAVPEDERHGPIAVDESGQPFQRRYYVQLYTELAKDAKVPNEVWNMRARHGGVSEAKDAGADPVDIGKHAQHSNLQTTYKHYIVPNIETSRRVAKARVAHRQSKKDLA
jgi:hypothetical protein